MPMDDNGREQEMDAGTGPNGWDDLRGEEAAPSPPRNPFPPRRMDAGDGMIEVPVEDLFNGVINVLGDGLGLAIVGTGKATRFLARAPDLLAARLKTGVSVLGDNLMRLTGRGR